MSIKAQSIFFISTYLDLVEEEIDGLVSTKGSSDAVDVEGPESESDDDGANEKSKSFNLS